MINWSILIGLTAFYQILKGRTSRQLYSMWFFRKNKKYSKSFDYVIDRNDKYLNFFFQDQKRTVVAPFIDGSQGIGKTTYLLYLADYYSKSMPIIYISLRDSKTSNDFSNIAKYFKYIPTLDLSKI